MRMLAACLSFSLLTASAPAEAESARVLAWVGPRLPGSPRAGQLLAEGELRVPAGTTLQLLLGSSTASASLALLGPARGRLGRGAVELHEAEAALLSGPALLLLPGGFRVEPGASGSVAFERGQLHARAGEVRVTPPPRRLLGQSGYAELPPTLLLRAPRSVRLGLGAALVAARGALPEETLRLLTRFGEPPGWRHQLGPVGTAEVGRAVDATRAERQRERQAASCGCTESRTGSAGQVPGSGSGLSPIERSGATLRVRITGIPRSAP